MNRTTIEWSDLTSNPLKYRDAAGNIVWGCVHHSPGCKNCYAETLAKRYGRGGPFNVPTMNGLTPFLDEAELHKMRTAKTVGGIAVAGSRCFVGDMTDIFGEWVPDELLDRLFAVFALRPDVTWQVLTKRAGRMRDYITDKRRVLAVSEYLAGSAPFMLQWPLPNCWLGVSAEDQQRADERIPFLLKTPAAVRFVSAEPLLGPISFRWAKWDDHGPHLRRTKQLYPPVERDGRIIAGNVNHLDGLRMLDWVIVGGESGPGSRPMDIGWARSIVEECKEASVACFFKQAGDNAGRTGRHNMAAGQWVPLKFKKRKGGDPSEWPEDVRVREWPEARQ